MDGTINLSKLAKYFSDEDAARALLEDMRWQGNPTCPHCGGLEPYTLTAKATSKKPGRKGLYKCKACRKQFTVTVGTVFEDSRIPISKWLLGDSPDFVVEERHERASDSPDARHQLQGRVVHDAPSALRDERGTVGWI